MRTDSGSTRSIWMEGIGDGLPAPLARDLDTEVCVVGAGIAGLTTAYLLARDGRRVVVLDDGPIGGGETCRTTAHLTNVIDDRYFEIERMHGKTGARLAGESHGVAIDLVGEIVADERIACDYRRLDAWLYAPADEKPGVIDRELEASRAAGVLVDVLERGPMPFVRGPCLRFPNQAAFHPMRYLHGLARAIERRGGRIARAHVTEIEDGAPARVGTEGGPSVRAREVVVATNSPIHAWVRYHTQQAPYRTFVVAAPVPGGSVPDVLVYDTCQPYHYVRLERGVQGGDDVLVVGGADHKTGQEDDGARRLRGLEDWMRQRFPSAGPVSHRWSGQVLETVDGLAMIGRDGKSEHVYVITGDSGMGMTHTTIGAMIVSDLIAGHHNRWADLYSPSRHTLGAALEYAKENLNVAAQYADHLKGGEVKSIDDVRPGQGAIVRDGKHQLAVHRDRGGQVTVRSAICTHLGCVVSWNSTEASWDCPCHGSRFAVDGHVVNGPAVAPLAAKEAAQAQR
jgi:glycine/D-amino acid oxidase-like deaminating enzyme/nitrite reductase/ring-hydroxylating ferredoxin subunit